MTTAICIMLGLLTGACIIIGIHIRNLEHTLYVQANDIIHCMNEQTKAIQELVKTIQEVKHHD